MSPITVAIILAGLVAIGVLAGRPKEAPVREPRRGRNP